MRIVVTSVFAALIVATSGVSQTIPQPYGSPADSCYSVAALPGSEDLTFTVIGLREDCAPKSVWVWYAKYQPDPLRSGEMVPLEGKMVEVGLGQTLSVSPVVAGAYRVYPQVPPVTMTTVPGEGGYQTIPVFPAPAPYYETTLAVVGGSGVNSPEFAAQPRVTGVFRVEGTKYRLGVRLHGPTFGIFYSQAEDGLLVYRQDLVESSPGILTLELPEQFSGQVVSVQLVDITTGLAGTYLLQKKDASRQYPSGDRGRGVPRIRVGRRR